MPDAAPAAVPTLLRFGPSGRFVLEPGERRLFIDGKPASLGARALDLLLVLAAQPDHLLTRNELLDRVWPGLVVEEANIQVQISNLRKVLGGDAIATVPGRGYRFAAAIESDAPEIPTAAPAAAGPMPAQEIAAQASAPRLVGRAQDLARLEDLLRDASCVTLAGTAGVGKTSLARSAASRWCGRSAWVDLAGLTQGAQVMPALGRALGHPLDDADPLPALQRALQGAGETLIVLDNAEHLVQSCAELLTSLQRPALRWLVTSQLPLAVAGEKVLRLEPLTLHAAFDGDGLGDGALALLAERITAADHRFRPEPALMPTLQEICTRLDGLPLAIEMAAARVPMLGLGGVRDALAERFALLTRGHRDAAVRHRTLYNALDWSYRLLAPAEQALLRQLAVFAGGFTLELTVALASSLKAGEAVSRWDVIDLLAGLVDRSLVVAGTEDPPRYRLLETVRAYGLEQLGRTGEEAVARRRHAEVVRDLFARMTPGDVVIKALCQPEMENARTAWSWGQTEDLGLAVQVANGAMLASTFTIWRIECMRWLQALEPALQSPAGAALPLSLQAAWWLQHARAFVMATDARGVPAARQAVALARQLDDPRRLLFAQALWTRAISEPGPELDEATASLQSALATMTDLSPRERLQVQGSLSQAAVVRGDMAAALQGREAERSLAEQAGWAAAADAAETNVLLMLDVLGRAEEAVVRGRALVARIENLESGAQGNLPFALNGLMVACITQGYLDEAAALVPRAHAARQRFAIEALPPRLVLLAEARQRYEAAARLVGHMKASGEMRGAVLEGPELPALERVQRKLVEVLGAARAAELEHEGRALDDDAAAALAVESGP